MSSTNEAVTLGIGPYLLDDLADFGHRERPGHLDAYDAVIAIDLVAVRRRPILVHSQARRCRPVSNEQPLLS